MTPNEILAKVKETILTHGWCKGKFESNGAVCLVGAFNMVFRGTPTLNFNSSGVRDEDEQSVRTGLARRLGRPLVVFNDDPTTNLDDVIEALSETA